MEKDMTQSNSNSCDNDLNDVSIMSTDTDCLEGIREALKIAMLTNQIVEVGLYCNGEAEVIEGRIIEVSCRTFCIRLEDIRARRGSCEQEKTLKFDIENVEYVKFC